MSTIGLISLGCAKNTVDSERLLTALRSLGFELSHEETRCDLLIINTCAFIHDAQQESLEQIAHALKICPRVIVTGCLGAQKSLLKERFPSLLGVFAPGRRSAVLRCIINTLGYPPYGSGQSFDSAGLLLTPPSYAYLKIAEGCSHRCSFCIIPSLRGALRSRLPRALIKETEALAARGIKELVVIAQDSSAYGRDLKLSNGLPLFHNFKQLQDYAAARRTDNKLPSSSGDDADLPEREHLSELLRTQEPWGQEVPEVVRREAGPALKYLGIGERVLSLGADARERELGYLSDQPPLSALLEHLSSYIPWIRVHYVYPDKSVTALVELMAAHKVLPYLDVPLQHASLPVLRAMRRPGDLEGLLRTIEGWRKICPELTLRSTFITGFPGESESDFKELLSFIREVRFDRAGVFTFSAVPGCAAAQFDSQVPTELALERAAELMQLQSQISSQKLERRLGKVELLLIDEIDELGQARCRSAAEAPEVDGVITVNHLGRLKAGDFLLARITAHDEHDLKGRTLGEEEYAQAAQIVANLTPELFHSLGGGHNEAEVHTPPGRKTAPGGNVISGGLPFKIL